MQNKVEDRKPRKGRPRSPSRGRTTVASRKKSPARSPAKRSTARKASPSRKARVSPSFSPVRKSPSRRSPSRRVAAVKATILMDSESDTDLEEKIKKVEKEKPKATVRARRRKTDEEVEPILKESEEVLNAYAGEVIRRVTRNQSREVERVMHLKNFESSSKKLGEFSDEDITSSEKLETKPDQFGGIIGALFYIIAIPLSVILLFIFCNENQCSCTKLPNFKKLLQLPLYFNLTAILGYFAFANVLAILSALPFGGKKHLGLPNKHGKLVYVMNGLFSLIVLTLLIVGLETRRIHIVSFILDHLFHLAVASILFGVVASIYLYVRSFYVNVSALNPYAVNKSAMYGFFLGRELTPRLFNLVDLKFYFLRISLISWFIIDVCCLYKSLGLPTDPTLNDLIDVKQITIQPTLIIFVLLHSIYLLDSISCESVWLTSFEMQYEGLGYMGAVGYATYPFMYGAQTKFVLDYGIHLPTWQLVLAGIVFAVGFVFFRGANNQKDAFRKNPYSPASAHLETIPTQQGKKLLVSGFWGLVRHPNYLGDILMNLSFVPFVCCVPPVFFIYSIVLMLIHRTRRDHERCKQKYGTSWDRYCQRVKYVLLPKVY